MVVGSRLVRREDVSPEHEVQFVKAVTEGVEKFSNRLKEDERYLLKINRKLKEYQTRVKEKKLLEQEQRVYKLIKQPLPEGEYFQAYLGMMEKYCPSSSERKTKLILTGIVRLV